MRATSPTLISVAAGELLPDKIHIGLACGGLLHSTRNLPQRRLVGYADGTAIN